MCKQLVGNTFTVQHINVMDELDWRFFKFIIVLTSIGLFFAALCILDACIRSYWVRKQQLLPKHRAEEILNDCTLDIPNKFTLEMEREHPRPFYCSPPFDWS